MSAEQLYKDHPMAMFIHDPRVKQSIIDLMEQHALAEVERFANYLKDEGFCPDVAFSGHVKECHLSFITEEGKADAS